MLVREHRGSLNDSMKTVQEIEPTMAALHAHCAEVVNRMGLAALTFTEDDITVKSSGYDARIGWDTFLIHIEGFGVFGMCNQHPAPTLTV